jgi:hypothetical protein
MREAKTRKYHSPEFKAKVGLEAVRGVKTINEMPVGGPVKRERRGRYPDSCGQRSKLARFFIIIMATRLGKAGCPENPYCGIC